jgi:hypothetical protein
MKRAGIPLFVHIGLKGRAETTFADTLFHVAPQKNSRLLESQALQAGGAAFGSSPEVTPAFIQWLGPARATNRSGTPPSKRPSK